MPKIKILKDNSPIPYGKFSKGDDACTMEEVPAWHLLWLWDNASRWVRNEFPEIFVYIKENKQGLEQEFNKSKNPRNTMY